MQATRPSRFSQIFKTEFPLVIFIAMLALLLRVAALLSFRNSVYEGFLLWDEAIYHALATKIATGTYLSSSVYEFAPLPAYVFGGIYKLFSVDTNYIRILNVVLGSLTCLLIYEIGKQAFNKTIGIISGLFACVYGPFIFYSIVPMKTALSLFLFSLTVCSLQYLLKNHSPVWVLFTGIAAGLMLNVRGNFALVILVLPVIMLTLHNGRDVLIKKRLIAIVVFCAGLSVTLSPFAIRNYLTANEFALTTSQSGQNLYYGNNPDSSVPYFQPLPFARSSPFVQGIQFTIEASKRSGKVLTHQEASGFWIREVMNFAIRQPNVFIKKIGQKILALFNLYEPGLNYHIGFISQYIPFFKFPFPKFWLLFPLGAAGIIFTLFSSIRTRALGLVAFIYAFSLVIFYTTTTYRLPLLIIMIPFAAAGLVTLSHEIRRKNVRKLSIYISVVAILMVVTHIPVNGSGDLSAYYNTHAIALDSKGMKSEAEQVWLQSSELNQTFSAYADLALASTYLGKNDYIKTATHLAKIPDSSFAAAGKYDVLGDLFLNKRQVNNAVSAYKKSLDINSGQRKVRMKLINIYKLLGEQRLLSDELKRLNYVSGFYNLM